MRKSDPAVLTRKDIRGFLRDGEEKERPWSGVVAASLRGFSKEALFHLTVAYCNGTDVAPSPEIASQIGTDFVFFKGPERMAVVFLGLLSGFRLVAETREPTQKQVQRIQEAVTELKRNRQKFQAAVNWLCSKKESKRVASARTMSRLMQLGKLEWGRYPDIDKTNEKFVRYFEIHGLEHLRVRLSLQEGRLMLFPRCSHFVDLLCAFLLNECSRKSHEDMPLKICLECRRVFKTDRRADFCTRECQWKHYWTPARRRDDIYLKRLERRIEDCLKGRHGFGIQDLQPIVTSHNLSGRLDAIEKNWKEWPKMMNRISVIRAHITKQKSDGRRATNATRLG